MRACGVPRPGHQLPHEPLTSSKKSWKVLTLTLMKPVEPFAPTCVDIKMAQHNRLFPESIHFLIPRKCFYPHRQENTTPAISSVELQHFVSEDKVSDIAATLEHEKLEDNRERTIARARALRRKWGRIAKRGQPRLPRN